MLQIFGICVHTVANCNGMDTNAKTKIMFFIRLSLSSHFFNWFFLSLLTSNSHLNRERTKWHTSHLQTISSKARWPLSPEAQAAWVRTWLTSLLLMAHEPLSSPTSKMKRAKTSPCLAFQVSLISLATISPWFGILGWCCGFEIWDGAGGF